MAISYENTSNTINHNVIDIKSDFLIDALHIFVLSGFALAQPLFALMSQYAAFFVARKSEPIDIILLVFILCLVLPGIGVLFELLASVFGRRFRKALHWFMVATLSAVIALQVLNKIFEIPGLHLIVIASALGVAATIAYVRLRPARVFLTVLSPAILIFPGLFLFNSPVHRVVFPDKDPSAIDIKIDDPPPIIMVVFDELTVTSLMDEHHRIDAIRYPNFAALSRDSYWFRNATTVSDHTHIAIPAMLTGKYPSLSKLPSAHEHPNNLFTLLGGTYDLKVFEGTTRLCPERLNRRPFGRENLAIRMNSLLADLRVVYLHLLLPKDLAVNLPVILQTWKDFTAHEVEARNNEGNEESMFMKGIHDLVKRAKKETRKHRGEVFRQFIRAIGSKKRPTLYFLHSLLPHVPYTYLPSGKTYGAGLRLDGLTSKHWGDDETAIVRAYQRYLLQVGYIDTLIGELITHLKAVGLYKRSLIVVTADHGVSFRANCPRRYVKRTNYQDIMQVPLFIKAPNQSGGVICDRNVELIDVLPTISDILGIRLPWPVDGLSALDASTPDRKEKVIFAKQTAEDRHVFEPILAAKYNTLEWQLTLFGSGEEPDGLFRIGPYNNMIGKRVRDIDIAEAGDFVVELVREQDCKEIDLKSTFLPAQIKGVVIDLIQAELAKHIDPKAPLVFDQNSSLAMIGSPSQSSLNIAIAINGTIRAVTKTSTIGRGIQRFSAMVPESSFRKGSNDIDILILSKSGGQMCLEGIKKRAPTEYSSAASGAKAHGSIMLSNGRSIPILSKGLTGYLDVAKVINDRTVFAGWAADVKYSRLPESILAFLDGKLVYSGKTDRKRPDIAQYFKNSSLKMTGFKFMVPTHFFTGEVNPELRIFAVSKEGVATELKYPENYKWSKN